MKKDFRINVADMTQNVNYTPLFNAIKKFSRNFVALMLAPRPETTRK